MRKIYAIAALSMFVSLAPLISAHAHDGDEGPGANREQKSGEMQEKRLEMMTKKLKLSSEQQATIKGIFEEQGKQMKELADKRKALHEESDTKIKAVLTDQQKVDYAVMQEKMHKKMEERMKERKEHRSEKK